MKRKFFLSLICGALASALIFSSACGTERQEPEDPSDGPVSGAPEDPSEQPGQTEDPSEQPGQTEDPTPQKPATPTVGPSGGYDGMAETIRFTLPDLGGKVPLHTEAQAKYLKERSYAVVYKYANGVNPDENGNPQELSYPLPVSFSWETVGTDANAEYTLTVGEGEAMDEAWTFSTTEQTADVYNFKVGTTYYWTVSAGGETSGKAYFTTESGGPRTLKVDGVANVRDLGGWKTAGGKTVKQGLLYRCGRLNENYSGKITITESGIETMLSTMKVKTELDFRGGANDPSEYGNVNRSMLGDGVTYHHIGMNWDGNILALNPKQIKEVFSILADENSYPLIFHCSIGTDRTGIIAYFVLGLLGVEEADICRDYLFSNFAYIQGARDLGGIRNTYVADINSHEGDLPQKIRATLLEIGVTDAQLDSVIRILGGD